MKKIIVIIILLFVPSLVMAEQGLVCDTVGDVKVLFSDKVITPRIGDWVNDGMKVKLSGRSSVVILFTSGSVVRFNAKGTYVLTKELVSGKSSSKWAFIPKTRNFEYVMKDLLKLYGRPPHQYETGPVVASQALVVFPKFSGEKPDYALSRAESIKLQSELAAVNKDYGIVSAGGKSFMNTLVYCKFRQYHKMLGELFKLYVPYGEKSSVGVKQLIALSFGRMGLPEESFKFWPKGAAKNKEADIFKDIKNELLDDK